VSEPHPSPPAASPGQGGGGATGTADAESGATATSPGEAGAPGLPHPQRGTRRRYAIMIATAAVVLGVDHLSKWLVSSHLALGQQVPSTPALVNIHYIHNSGAAFGLFPQFSYLYLVVAALVAAYIALYGPRMGGGLLRLLALGCVLGGAISNGIDRAVSGYVTDFIDFHFWLFQIFNCADMAIVGGMLVLVIQLGFGSGEGAAPARRP
jgi:signal peptidase II